VLTKVDMHVLVATFLSLPSFLSFSPSFPPSPHHPNLGQQCMQQ